MAIILTVLTIIVIAAIIYFAGEFILDLILAISDILMFLVICVFGIVLACAIVTGIYQFITNILS